MNKTINIHLAHILFTLDEKAYEILKDYLNTLEKMLKNTEGGNDILEDIELRIAELFSEKKHNPDDVISVEIVEKVLATLGAPEDFMDEDLEDNKTTFTEPKKLFRDPDDRFIGGVAGGLSHYIGIDSLWIRLILLILFFSSVGGVVLIYILLWILIPEAQTTAEKLKMKGEPVNVSNISKKIKEELDQVGDKVKDVDYENLGNQLKKKSKTLVDLVVKLILYLLKFLGLLVGILLLFVSSISLIGIFIGLTMFGIIGSSFFPMDFLYLLSGTALPISIITILLATSIGIPFLFLFSAGLRLMSNKGPVMKQITRNILLVIWLITLLIAVVFGGVEFRSKAITTTNTDRVYLPIEKKDTLKLFANDMNEFEETMVISNQFNFSGLKFITKEDGKDYRVSSDIRLLIELSKSNEIELNIEKKAFGWSKQRATKTTSLMNYQHDYNDGKLLLNNYWIAPTSERNKPDKVNLKLKIPEGQYIWIDDELSSHLSSKIKNDKNYYRRDIAGHLWKMQKGQLICQDCESLSGEIEFSEDKMSFDISNDESELELNIGNDGIRIKKKNNDD